MIQPSPTELNVVASPELSWVFPQQVVPLITELEIKRRIAQIAQAIATKQNGERLVVVVVLKGSFMFAADLLRRLYECNVSPQIDFIRATSYGYADVSSGKVSLLLDVSIDLRGCCVLLVDDIADSGVTLTHLVEHVIRKGAAKVETCVLIDKPSNRSTPFVPDYIGFEISNQFVVGYGLDHAENYRNIPFIVGLQRLGE